MIVLWHTEIETEKILVKFFRFLFHLLFYLFLVEEKSFFEQSINTTYTLSVIMYSKDNLTNQREIELQKEVSNWFIVFYQDKKKIKKVELKKLQKEKFIKIQPKVNIVIKNKANYIFELIEWEKIPKSTTTGQIITLLRKENILYSPSKGYLTSEMISEKTNYTKRQITQTALILYYIGLLTIHTKESRKSFKFYPYCWILTDNGMNYSKE